MSKPKGVKVTITERALLQRVNRKLAATNQRVLRQKEWFDDRGVGPHYRDANLGRFYVVDTVIGGAVDQNIDLEDFANELGVLKPWEQLGDE